MTVGQKLLEYMLEKHGNMKNKLIPNIQKIGNYSFDSNLLYPASDIIQKKVNPQGGSKIFMTDDYRMVSRNPDGSYKFHNTPSVNEQLKNNNKLSNIQKVGDINFDSNKLREPTKTYMEMYLPNYKGKDKVLSSDELLQKSNFRKKDGVYEGLVVRNQDGSYKLFNKEDYLPDAPVIAKSKQETPQWIKDRATKKTDVVNFYETLNYKNWGLKDYSDYTTRGSAFRNARANGEKEFMYKGVRYNTNYAGTPEQQLKETGLTNEQIQNRSKINKSLGKNLLPVSYENLPLRYILSSKFNVKESNRQFIDNLLNNKMTTEDKKQFNDLIKTSGLSSDELKKRYANRMDAYNLYLGIPQKNNTLEVSNQVPSKSTEKNKTYYKYNDEAKNKLAKELIDWANTNSEEKGVLTDLKQFVMGDYTVSKGKDKRGNYISYYDKWDLDPLGSQVKSLDYGKPFEMYDKIYVKKQGDKYVKMNYTDDELSKLNPNSKNFDVKALQEELSTRGYDMWSSRNKTGFDGIYGNDTKSALEAYQSGIPAFEYNAFKYEKENKKMYGGKLLPSLNKF
ncbi:MAG: peptidoglycan-binding protein [Caulobacteraceae bacterium]|nr:peptidoglycan-binding protein [Caulobacteraceae bacterium]